MPVAIARPVLDRLRLLPGITPRLLDGIVPARIRTGSIALDRLLGGGVPRGVLTEILGAECSGRTSLAHALVAAVTATGGLAAYIDWPDAFVPEHARDVGVELARVLWVRPCDLRATLQAAEHVLRMGGFGVVIVDVARPHARIVPPAAGVWLRLVRAAAQESTAAVVLGEHSVAGTFAALRVAVVRDACGFVGTAGPCPFFDGFTSTIHVRKNRLTPPAVAAVQLRTACG
jgi:hypothetical protein